MNFFVPVLWSGPGEGCLHSVDVIMYMYISVVLFYKFLCSVVRPWRKMPSLLHVMMYIYLFYNIFVVLTDPRERYFHSVHQHRPDGNDDVCHQQQGQGEYLITRIMAKIILPLSLWHSFSLMVKENGYWIFNFWMFF